MKFFLKTLIYCALTMPFNSAWSQNYTSYFTGSTTDMVTNPSGGSCLMGGASEDDNAMQWFLNRANGGDILVLRASGSDGYNDYFYNQLGVNVNSVETIKFNNASASAETYIHDKIKQAEAIWFAGGDQWDYISYWRDTPIDSLINEAIRNRNIVIGGTSAGMAIASQYYFSAENGTVTSNQALSNPYDPKVAIGTSPFLDIPHLGNVITDTHYDARDRFGRHAVFIARLLTDIGIYPKGIACEEYTAICINENGVARVFGEPTEQDFAYFIRPNCNLETYTPELCAIGEQLDWNFGGEALIVYKVKGTADGSNMLDLNDWLTGTGGVWEYWYVDDGQFNYQSAPSPNCSGVITQELIRVQNGALFIENESGLVLKGKDGNCYQIIIDQSGILDHIQIQCPE